MLVETLGPPVATTGTVLLCVAPLLTGIHMLVSALKLDIQSTPTDRYRALIRSVPSERQRREPR